MVDHHETEEAPNEIRLTKRGLIAAAGLVPVAVLTGAAFAQTAGAPGAAPAGAPPRPRPAPPKPGDIDTRLKTVEACVLSPQSVEGPFYFETKLIRNDIREDQVGTPLTVNFQVIDANDCKPVSEALVSVWQSNAEGYYSGYTNSNPNFGVPPANSTPKIPHQDPMTPERWLRGAARADADGRVTFQTIFPSWYMPRAPHIHVKAFLKGGAEVITTQYYFPQSVLNQVLNSGVYAKRGAGLITNESDFVRKQSGSLGPTFSITQDAQGGWVANAILGVAHA